MQPIRLLQQTTHFKLASIVEDGKTQEKYVGCSPSDPDAKPMTIMEVPPGQAYIPPVTMVCHTISVLSPYFFSIFFVGTNDEVSKICSLFCLGSRRNQVY